MVYTSLALQFDWPIAIKLALIMPSFVYVARETASGREIRNSVEATTEQAAIAALLNRNLLVVSIQEKIGKRAAPAGPVSRLLI